ncbi:hypothetical protein [Herbaspirillum seropedicae]|uniref:hypothetical protein n=1 Tax=Herbaspirillum seropedicae TaxID=964 RepID=UPI00285B0552|nr:hypothetical protein [Herbaspirillum seropedicae]MDR6396133.1 hypothetical protein [Herbaspirillum seropedicae]
MAQAIGMLATATPVASRQENGLIDTTNQASQDEASLCLFFITFYWLFVYRTSVC